MAKAEKVNEIEVARDERIKAEAAKIRAREDAEILAAATAKVEAEIAAEEAKAKAEEDAKFAAEAAAEAAKVRAKRLGSFAKSVGDWMVDNDCTNPSSIPASVTDALRVAAGL